jgi:hypothetical protein
MQSKVLCKIQECFEVPSKTKFLLGTLLLLSFSLTAYPQALPASPTVYVSGGATIYQLANGTLNPIFTSNVNGANFESLAIGPDSVDLDPLGSGNAQYAYFLYACDPAGTIIRIAFLPAANSNTPPTVSGTPDTVYSGGVLGLAPVCGRSSSTGDFYIANKSGAGVFVFSGIASVPFGGIPSPLTPTNLNFNLPQTGRGITQKYDGGLLVVDNSNNKVVRSPYTVPFNAPSNFINSNLNGPVGIAAAVTTALNPGTGVFVANSNFFVANSNTSKNLPAQPPISVFTFNDATQTGVPAAVCPALNFPKGGGPSQVADYLASAPLADATNANINNIIYLTANSKNSGSLWSWNTSQAQGAQPNCNLTPVASIGTPLSGVALGPAPVTLHVQLNATAQNPTPNNFNFNSSLFQITGQSCIASVTAYPLSVGTVESMITLAQLPNIGDRNAINQYPGPPFVPPAPLLNPATPLVGLGDGGFEIAYVAHWHPGFDGNNCGSVFPDGGFVTGMYNIIDSTQFTNPRILQCDNANPTTNIEPQLFPSTTTTCGSTNLIGVYPSGGPIGLDGGGRSNSVFLWVRETASAGNTTPGTFCGFQPDLAGNGTTLPSPLPSFSANGKGTLAVKFKLSSNNCMGPNGFITNAKALLSVARIFDANGAPVFNAINPNPTSASIDVPPLFPPGNSQYSFTLNLPSVFAQGGAGTYSVTVTFLSDNTTNQTTEFVLTQ